MYKNFKLCTRHATAISIHITQYFVKLVIASESFLSFTSEALATEKSPHQGQTLIEVKRIMKWEKEETWEIFTDF